MIRLFSYFSLGALALLIGSPVQADWITDYGASTGTYNAAASTSGVSIFDDTLYAGNDAWPSYTDGTGSQLIGYKLISVDVESTFWGVTGNGTFNGSLTDPGSVDWFFTVDPATAALATANPLAGSIGNEELSLTDSILRGDGFLGPPTEDFDLLLNASDGQGLILGPGQYYVSVFSDSSPLAGSWFWSELSTEGVPSDIFYADALHSPGQFDLIKEFTNPTTGRPMLTGDLAFDVWMTPTSSVPEPSSLTLLAALIPCLLVRRKR